MTKTTEATRIAHNQAEFAKLQKKILKYVEARRIAEQAFDKLFHPAGFGYGIDYAGQQAAIDNGMSPGVGFGDLTC